MGLLRSFNIGITGLGASATSTSVISDNIANANTNGFKSSRAEFQDVLATSLKSVDGGDQLGTGTRLSHVKPLFTQGDISRTESVTDLAINGDGFFIIDAPFGHGYTRDGSMHFNKFGELVNSDGFKVLGFQANRNGDISNSLGAISFPGGNMPAEATKKVNILLNLNSFEKMKIFDEKNPFESAQFVQTMTVYDNVGIARLLSITYNKTSDNNWEYRVFANAEDTVDGKPDDPPVEMAGGSLIFNNRGELQEEIEQSNSFNFNNGAASNQVIKFDWGKSLKEGGDGTLSSTQYGSDSSVQRYTQDGHSSSNLSSIILDEDGTLSGIYSNGVSMNIARLALARFDNIEGLFKKGKNLFKSTKKSGQGLVGKPGESGRGRILSKSLELSNVDIANEFVSLLNAQRNFVANTKVIKTTNEMLDEVLNIKR